MTKERKVIATFTISPQSAETLARLARSDDRSRSWIVDNAIKAYAQDRNVVDAHLAAQDQGSFINKTMLERALSEHDAALVCAERHFQFVSGERLPVVREAMSDPAGIPVRARSAAGVGPLPDVGRILSEKAR